MNDETNKDMLRPAAGTGFGLESMMQGGVLMKLGKAIDQTPQVKGESMGQRLTRVAQNPNFQAGLQQSAMALGMSGAGGGKGPKTPKAAVPIKPKLSSGNVKDLENQYKEVPSFQQYQADAAKHYDTAGNNEMNQYYQTFATNAHKGNLTNPDGTVRLMPSTPQVQRDIVRSNHQYMKDSFGPSYQKIMSSHPALQKLHDLGADGLNPEEITQILQML